MTRLIKISWFFMLMSALVSLGAEASKNYSILDGDNGNNEDTESHDVYIVAIDGKQLFDKKRYKLESGSHYVTLRSAKANKFSSKKTVTQRSYSLMLKPCVKYLLSAQHLSSGF